ncbi:hypothetical protein B0T17DRAFT_185427 [Bombardia bombarda]|uniref:Uncharacterized protein n=1 Tax=Bombardia bombarda TaxID=252184 RepID=A0AA39X9X3_9PEZI|nr:hypothetical protein B0T17DRAFT_185427 [Bombardia bombarda]
MGKMVWQQWKRRPTSLSGQSCAHASFIASLPCSSGQAACDRVEVIHTSEKGLQPKIWCPMGYESRVEPFGTTGTLAEPFTGAVVVGRGWWGGGSSASSGHIPVGVQRHPHFRLRMCVGDMYRHGTSSEAMGRCVLVLDLVHGKPQKSEIRVWRLASGLAGPSIPTPGCLNVAWMLEVGSDVAGRHDECLAFSLPWQMLAGHDVQPEIVVAEGHEDVIGEGQAVI